MNNIKRITIFCGSNSGKNKLYTQEVENFAKILCDQNITMVYGGSKTGLMGVIANKMLTEGGEVIGVTTKFLKDLEIAHDRLGDLRTVDSMHERKKMMYDLSDAFILLPGGCGSLDEFFEIYTWAQLEQHNKPVGILNINNYYQHLIKMLDHARDEGFVKAGHRDMVIIDNSAEKLIAKFEKYVAPKLSKWFKESTS